MISTGSCDLYKYLASNMRGGKKEREKQNKRNGEERKQRKSNDRAGPEPGWARLAKSKHKRDLGADLGTNCRNNSARKTMRQQKHLEGNQTGGNKAQWIKFTCCQVELCGLWTEFAFALTECAGAFFRPKLLPLTSTLYLIISGFEMALSVNLGEGFEMSSLCDVTKQYAND